MNTSININKPESSLSSAPLKKRSKMLSGTDGGAQNAIKQLSDEEAAAAALAGLNKAQKGTSTMTASTGSNDRNSHNSVKDINPSSDCDESVASNDSVPKAVHRPPVNNTMVDHTYTDYSVVDENLLAFLQSDEDHENDSDITEDEKKTKERALKKIKKIFGDISPTRKNSGGVVKPFPEKLMEVLDRGDMDTIITWLPHGRAFIVRHPQKLKEVVLPRFFKQSKFMSFTRQLNLWGFKRITKGTDAGAYYHELFLRGRPLLSTLMRRQKIKGTGIKLTPNPDTEPNFYKISHKRPLPATSTEKELEPLPPISTSISTQRASPTKPAEPSNSLHSAYSNNSIDLYLNQRLEQQSKAQGLRQSRVPGLGRIGGGSFSGLSSHQSSLHDSLAFDMLQREAHAHQRPVQRLSAPTTSADFNLVAGSFQMKMKEQQAIASAQQLLNEVKTQTTTMPQNPIEDMKQKLLNAFHTLEQTQTAPPQPAAPSSMTQSFLGGGHCGLGQSHQLGHSSLYPYQNTAAASAYPSMSNLLSPQHHQRAYLGGAGGHTGSHSAAAAAAVAAQQSEPSRGSIAALMTALDQTRQVAAAAQAQSSLLQQVANDLALGRHSKK